MDFASAVHPKIVIHTDIILRLFLNRGGHPSLLRAASEEPTIEHTSFGLRMFGFIAKNGKTCG